MNGIDFDTITLPKSYRWLPDNRREYPEYALGHLSAPGGEVSLVEFTVVESGGYVCSSWGPSFWGESPQAAMNAWLEAMEDGEPTHWVDVISEYTRDARGVISREDVWEYVTGHYSGWEDGALDDSDIDRMMSDAEEDLHYGGEHTWSYIGDERFVWWSCDVCLGTVAHSDTHPYMSDAEVAKEFAKVPCLAYCGHTYAGPRDTCCCCGTVVGDSEDWRAEPAYYFLRV